MPVPGRRCRLTRRCPRQNKGHAATPESTRISLAQRLRAHAREHWPQLAAVHVRYHGQFAYVAAELTDGDRLPLMRLRYGGSAHRWGSAHLRGKQGQLRGPDLVQRRHRRGLRLGLRPPPDQHRPLITSSASTRTVNPRRTSGADHLVLARPVDVGAVLDGDDVDPVVVVADAVDDAVVAAACAVESLKAELEWLADTVRAGGQGPVKELHCCSGDLLGQPGKCLAAGSGPGDGVVVRAHRSAIRRSASSLVSSGALPVPSSSSASRMSARRAALSMTSRVSSRDSRSSTLMTTAAGWPCLVITTRPCSRSRRSTTSESRFLTSARGICSAMDIARS